MIIDQSLLIVLDLGIIIVCACFILLTPWIWFETNFNIPLWNSQRNNQWPILKVQSLKEVEKWVTNDKSLFDGSN